MRAQSMMMRTNRSAGVPEQALKSLTQIGQLEKLRRQQLARNDVYAAGRTLDGMAAAFAAAPTVDELRSALRERFPNGGITSGKEYYDLRQSGLGASFSATSNTDKSIDQFVAKMSMGKFAQPQVHPAVASFVQGGVQAAAYHYATGQQRYVGSGLGATMEMSTAEKAVRENNAQKRAKYLVVAASFAGLAGDESAQEGAKDGFVEWATKELEKFRNMNRQEAQKHAEWWVLGTLKNWGWASKKDIADLWCKLPDFVRYYQTKDGFKPIEWAFREKVASSKKANWSGGPWEWDAAFTTCSGGSSARDQAESYSSFKREQKKERQRAAMEESGDNTMMIVGAVAVAAALFLVLRK